MYFLLLAFPKIPMPFHHSFGAFARFAFVVSMLLHLAVSSPIDSGVQGSGGKHSVHVVSSGEAQPSGVRRSRQVATQHVDLNAIHVRRQTAAKRDKQHIAVLTSGQTYRFTYQDSLAHVEGGLTGLACGNGGAPCDIQTDVYVMLADTQGPHWSGVVPHLPPYGHSLKEIRSYYLEQGANYVYADVLLEEEIDNQMTLLQQQVGARGASEAKVSVEEWWQQAQRVYWFQKRMNAVPRMWFIRHAVFKAALAAETRLGYSYSHFLYIREDGVLFHPTYTLRSLMEKSASVLVDSHCGYHSWPDRVYFTSRQGGRALFTATLDEFVDRIALWLQMGLKHPQHQRAPPKRKPEGKWKKHHKSSQLKKHASLFEYSQAEGQDPLQPEHFVKTLLLGTASRERVQVMNFAYVTGFRYVNAGAGVIKPCITHYYRNCSEFSDRVAPACPFEETDLGPQPDYYKHPFHISDTQNKILKSGKKYQ